MRPPDHEPLERAFAALTDIAHLEREAAAGRLGALLDRFSHTLAAVPVGDPRRSVLASLHEALRVDAAFLGRHPSALFQCLFNRCSWIEDPRTAHFYDPPPPGAPPWSPPREAPPSGRLLAPILAAWLDAKERADPGFFWLRSLRPPEVPLGVASAWDLERGVGSVRRPAKWPTWYSWSSALFSPDGRRVVTGSLLCDAVTGAPIAWLDVKIIERLEGSSPQGCFQVVGDRFVSLDGGVRVWSMDDGARLVDDRRRYYAQCNVVAFEPAGRRYVISGPRFGERDAGDDGSGTVVLDLDTGRLLAKLPVEHVSVLAFSADGERIASGAKDGKLRVFSAADGATLCEISGHAREVTGIVFSADGRKLVSAGDDEALTVWDLQSGEKLASRPLDGRDPMYTRWSNGVTTRHHRWWATPEAIVALDGWAGFAVAPPPQVFAAEARDGDIAIVRRATGEVVAWFPASEPVAAHPGGRIWAGACCHFVLEGSA